MSINIYYTSPNSKLCALNHDLRLTEECMETYKNLLLMSHKKLDGIPHKLRVSQLCYLESIEVIECPSLYWVTCSTYHYKWLWECFIYLVIQYEKYVKKTVTSKYIGILEEPPHNILRRGFKPPYPINPSTKEDVIEYNIKHIKALYEKYNPEWPWLPVTPEWY